MKMKNLFLVGLVIVLLISCEEGEKEKSQTSYFPLEVGNYWIYSHVDIDTMGNETVRDNVDSVVVTKDTLINGEEYFVLEGLKVPSGSVRGIVDIVRDSSGYLINNEGVVRFSSKNFTDILTTRFYINGDDTIGSTTYKMMKEESIVSVPAGKFDALNFKGTVVSNNPILGIDNPRYLDNYYVEGVGRILSTYFYFHSPVISERRLIRYNVN